MKIFFAVPVLLLIGGLNVGAQAPQPVPESVPTYSPVIPPTTAAAASPSASPDTTLDPAKVAEYQRRFEQGHALEQQGQLSQARDIYDGILAEQPNARGSLFGAGRISFKLGELLKAETYFDRLHALEPNFPDAIQFLIEINQSLNRDVKTERMLSEYRALHASGKIPAFSNSPNFVRERIQLGQDDQFIMTEFFDHTADPFVAWIGERQDSHGHIQRQFMLRYDPDATKEIRAKDPKYASAEEFLLVDDVIQDNHIVRIDVYRQIFSLPDYKKLRNTMLAIMAGGMKPIYSQPVGTTPANP